MPMIVKFNVRNICILAGSLCLLFVVYNVGTIVYEYGFLVVFSVGKVQAVCNKGVTWLTPSTGSRPVIGVLGPRGSGVVWLRELIEQVTGLHTGSVEQDDTHSFVGDGKTKEVVVVLAHDVNKLPMMQAGIILFRNMKQTVRTTYAQKHGPGTLLEAPLHAYYGKEWLSFALQESHLWAQRYQQYLTCNKPLLILNFNELDDPNKIQSTILKISNFLHVPIKHSVLDCVVENSQSFGTRPRPLRIGFQPFSLLPMQELSKLRRMENFTESAVRRARASYRPKVLV